MNRLPDEVVQALKDWRFSSALDAVGRHQDMAIEDKVLILALHQAYGNSGMLEGCQGTIVGAVVDQLLADDLHLPPLDMNPATGKGLLSQVRDMADKIVGELPGVTGLVVPEELKVAMRRRLMRMWLHGWDERRRQDSHARQDMPAMSGGQDGYA